VTVSLPSNLLATVDREARGSALSRSAVMEAWLEYGRKRKIARDLDAEIEAYYGSLSGPERAEDEALAEASLRAAAELEIDGPPARSRRRGSRRGRG